MRWRMDISTELKEQIQSHRGYLVHYASMHLRNSAAAEDAVQETLLAALSSASSFQGRADLRARAGFGGRE